MVKHVDESRMVVSVAGERWKLEVAFSGYKVSVL